MYTAKKDRYKDAEFNRCGKSGLLLPKVSLGFWHNFGTNGEYESHVFYGF